MTVLSFTKGHGTQNDFVLMDDRDNALDLDEALVRKLAHRRSGLGADGVIRVVQSKDIVEGAKILREEPTARWFMDYRNGDGSIAQMCGNGVRVFAAFLESLGLVSFSHGQDIAIGTRAGVRTVRKEGEWFTVGMGRFSLPFAADAISNGADSSVRIVGIKGLGEDDIRPALSVNMGNPHTVVAVASQEELADVDFTQIPEVSPLPPEGTNVEAVVPLPLVTNRDGSVSGHVAMRVHERGVGETQSCGTGACAAAVAVRLWTQQASTEPHLVPDTWLVDVPGGRVSVKITQDNVELSGPACLIAHGEVELDAL